MSVEVENEERRILALREQTKTFFGLEKPLYQKYTKVVNNLDELISQLHCVFSSDSVNVEWVDWAMRKVETRKNLWFMSKTFSQIC